MLRKKNNLKESLSRIQKLEEQDAKKTEFFLTASHQLKSPLAIMLWCLEIALESKEVKGKDKEMVNKAVTQGKAMQQLITDMLHVFRLVSKKDKQQDYVAVNLNTLIEEVVGQYQIMAHKKGIRLVKGEIEALPDVYADEAYLKQALINLIDNGIKYSLEKGSVKVSAEVKNKQACISVQDHGMGMTEADQRLLFTEFFRSAEAQEKVHEGTGLGLVLVKHIVEAFGGEIKVESTLHKGSTFTICFPVES